MKQNNRLQGAISAFQSLVKRYDKQGTFKVTYDKITIYNNSPQLWGTIFYLTIAVLFPAGLFTYYLIKGSTDLNFVWLPIVVILFSYYLYKMLRGNTLLIIDFSKKNVRAENNNGVFSIFFKTKTIPFNDLQDIDLREKSIPGKINTRWLQLIATKKNKEEVILTDFSNNFPEDLIAKKIKSLVEVIIWTENTKDEFNI